MVRISINQGSNNGINPSEIVGSITRFSKIPGKSIGKIQIKDDYSIVDIESKYINKVMDKTGKIRMRKQPVMFKRISDS